MDSERDRAADLGADSGSEGKSDGSGGRDEALPFSAKRKRQILTLEQRVALLDEVERRAKKQETWLYRSQGEWLQDKFKLDWRPGKTVLARTHKSKQALRAEYSTAQNAHQLGRKKLRHSEYPEVEAKLNDWVRFQEATNNPYGDQAMMEQARRIASELNIDTTKGTCKFGESWVEGFKKRRKKHKPVSKEEAMEAMGTLLSFVAQSRTQRSEGGVAVEELDTAYSNLKRIHVTLLSLEQPAGGEHAAAAGNPQGHTQASRRAGGQSHVSSYLPTAPYALSGTEIAYGAVAYGSIRAVRY